MHASVPVALHLHASRRFIHSLGSVNQQLRGASEVGRTVGWRWDRDAHRPAGKCGLLVSAVYLAFRTAAEAEAYPLGRNLYS